MNPELTMEQAYLLHKIALEIKNYSRDDLIEALLDCWEGRFKQKQVFLMASKDAGFAFKFTEGVACLPTREEEADSDIALLEEDEETLQDIVDSANFELDMDAIVLGNDE